MNKREQAVIIGVDPQVLNDKKLWDIIKTTQVVLKKAVQLLKEAGEEDRRGGYATIIREDLWPLVVRLPMGIIPLEKASKWSELSTEKCLRLMENEDFASHESRDPEAEIITLQGAIEKWGKWGGGIKVWKHLLGFSGLPELWDEAVELVVAIKCDLLSKAIAFHNISHERNPHLRTLLAAVEG